MTTAAPMPTIFFGHGNPMNALLVNEFSTAWRAIGASLPRPRAVLSVSAHWYIAGTAVTATPTPKTIHDFGGFPDELFAVEYPAPGEPALAERVRELLAPVAAVAADRSWGLDHGTWSVLVHVFPDADVPVVQLSIDRDREPAYHYALGRALAPLRDEGVLVIGSGNIVHNLHTYAWGRHSEPLDWATRFDAQARAFIEQGDDERLVAYESLGADARLSIPTPEHYLPLLYVLGLRRPDDAVSFPVSGIDGGSVSMRSVRFG